MSSFLSFVFFSTKIVDGIAMDQLYSMMYSMSNISHAEFQSALQAYPDMISPELAALDGSRYGSIPDSLAWQVSRGQNPSLSQSQRQVLQDWTAARSSNHSIAQALDNVDVEKSTRHAFQRVFRSRSDEAILEAVQGLKTVGLVQASLLLSVCRPNDIPFFSKELRAWWLLKQSQHAGGGDDVKHPDAFSVEEYLRMLEGAQKLRQRLGDDVGMMEIEKVAFVLDQWRKDEGGKVDVMVDEGSEHELA